MKSCLIVVDYQIDFVCGSLGFDDAVKIDSAIAEKIAEYRKENNEIIFTFDTHGTDYPTTREGRHLPVEHCIKGTDGHKLYGKTALMKTDDDKCFYKPSFGSAELFEYLKSAKFDAIELCGVVTDICVISNAVLAAAACPQAEITVDSRCVASNDFANNSAALAVMKSLQMNIL